MRLEDWRWNLKILKRENPKLMLLMGNDFASWFLSDQFSRSPIVTRVLETYFPTSAVKRTGGTIKITDKASPFLRTESKTAGKFAHGLERGITVIPCQRRGSPSRIIVPQKCSFQSAVGEPLAVRTGSNLCSDLAVFFRSALRN